MGEAQARFPRKGEPCCHLLPAGGPRPGSIESGPSPPQPGQSAWRAAKRHCADDGVAVDQTARPRVCIHAALVRESALRPEAFQLRAHRRPLCAQRRASASRREAVRLRERVARRSPGRQHDRRLRRAGGPALREHVREGARARRERRSANRRDRNDGQLGDRYGLVFPSVPEKTPLGEAGRRIQVGARTARIRTQGCRLCPMSTSGVSSRPRTLSLRVSPVGPPRPRVLAPFQLPGNRPARPDPSPRNRHPSVYCRPPPKAARVDSHRSAGPGGRRKARRGRSALGEKGEQELWQKHRP